MMTLQTGTPPTEGRYLAFVQCEGRQVGDWAEPMILTFHGGRWHAWRPVLAWVGPIPPMRITDIREYDL